MKGAGERDGSATPARAPYLTSPWNRDFLAHAFKAAFKQHHRALLPILRPLIPRDAVILDVGAHAGQYTKLLARLAPEGFVYAIEPGSYARTILRLAISFNRLRNVAILPLALGDRAGLVTLSMPVKRSGSYGFGLTHAGLGGRPNSVREVAAMTTLDELAATLPLDRLDFIKVDIEGYEGALLRGGRETLRRFKPTLLMEMNAEQLVRAGDRLEDAWSLLVELGYTPHQATADGALKPVPTPITSDIWWIARQRFA
ncbi:MAG TPA: FkbM family methyltransferase [Stellaceae bacterium]|nr:FkbM family methyltransferase [Stellaceae bacterium]